MGELFCCENAHKIISYVCYYCHESSVSFLFAETIQVSAATSTLINSKMALSKQNRALSFFLFFLVVFHSPIHARCVIIKQNRL